jgi:serine/threonine-protein kinase HipA
VSQQTLSVNGKHRDITSEDLLTIAKANTIKKGAEIITIINDIVNNWVGFAAQAEVREDLKNLIQENLHTY